MTVIPKRLVFRACSSARTIAPRAIPTSMIMPYVQTDPPTVTSVSQLLAKVPGHVRSFSSTPQVAQEPSAPASRRLVFLGGDPSDPIEVRCHEEPHMLGLDRGFAGYFPVQLGHTIHDQDGGTYEIVRKLGWASYSNVWLALYKRYV